MDVLSKREKLKYAHNGYLFDKLTKDGNKKMWRCDRKDNRCKARLHTDAIMDTVIEERGVHNHGSDAAGIEVAMVVNSMKRRAANTQEGNFIVFKGISRNTSPGWGGALEPQNDEYIPLMKVLGKVKWGTKGSILGPCLFNIYIKDLYFTSFAMLTHTISLMIYSPLFLI